MCAYKNLLSTLCLSVTLLFSFTRKPFSVRHPKFKVLIPIPYNNLWLHLCIYKGLSDLWGRRWGIQQPH